MRFAFDHQPRNEKAKNNSTFTTIDVLIPGDPTKIEKTSTETIYTYHCKKTNASRTCSKILLRKQQHLYGYILAFAAARHT